VRGTAAVRVAAVTALAFVLSAGVAFAHYQFVHYTTSTGPFTAAPEKFDLNALPNRTVYFFITGKGPEKLAPGDSFTAILSQIREAAKTWSEVEASELRLEFGGLSASGTVQATPGLDVVFDELPPGLIAMGGPTTLSAMATGDSGSFVPITRSILVLQKDLSERPSYSEAFFLTAVHELGHALGLQHTLTSSVMSTQLTRSTTRAKPLAADDEAGISLLYPAVGFATRTASISGRVTLSGQGVHLASVVAIEPAGIAVSAFTDPDGYYRITGLPPGQYYIYVHPLPPGAQPGLGPADIVLPVDPGGKAVPAGPLFETGFYPDAKSIRQATMIVIQPGEARAGYNFAVRPRGALQLYGVTTYSFPGSYAVKPAFLNVNGPRNFLVASGTGLITNNAPSAGLRVEMLGGSATVLDDGVKAYAPAPAFLQVGFSFSPFGGQGPRHLFFSLNDDVFVLPDALYLVRSQPPSIASVTQGVDEQGNRTAVLAGSNLVESSHIFFDGLAAPVVSLDKATGSLVVLPPPGASDHRAVVTALDSDGQGSMFLNAGAPPTYTYDTAEPPSVAVSPSSLPAGSEAMIEITGVNTNFAEGQTIAGFGSSDVVVRRAWVRSPTELIANVHVAAQAKQTAAALTVIAGFQVATQPNALQIQAARPDVPVLNPVVVNPATGQPSIYAGGQAVLAVSNLPSGLTPAMASITINDFSAKILGVEGGRILFEAPPELSLGPAVLTLNLGTALPIVVVIDPPPPVIKAVSSLSYGAIGPKQPAVQGEDLWVTVAGVADPSVVANPERVRINLGGVTLSPEQVTPAETAPDTYIVRFRVPPSLKAGDSVPLTIAIGYRVSQPVSIPVGAAE
jgi:hypothetical protein